MARLPEPHPSSSSTSKLVTASHSWALKDTATGPAATATDSIGSLPLTGTGAMVNNPDGTQRYTGPSWHTGDLFTPDLQLDGTGEVVGATAAVTPSEDFTVSVWAKPDALGNIVLSQDGSLVATATSTRRCVTRAARG